MTWEPELGELRRREELAREMGGPDKVERQHAQGRLTVRERVAALLDVGTFHEVGALTGRGTYDAEGRLTDLLPANFVCGTGLVAGRKVVVAGDDFTVRGGAADASNWEKQAHAERMAHDLQLPLVRLVDGTGGGGSVKQLEMYGHTYVPANPGWDMVVDNLALVPVAAACLGPVAGLGAARAVHSHFSVLVEETAQLFVAGPPVVRHGTGEDLDKEDLGGARIHGSSGAVDAVASSEEEAFELVRQFLSYLPPSVFGLPPVVACPDPVDRRDDALLSIVPRDRRQPYAVRDILRAVLDEGSFLELYRYGGPVVAGLGRLGGHPVGVVAGDPRVGGGVLTDLGSDALTRLVDLCQTFHLPLVTFTDQPGIAIGAEAERRGTIRWAARAVAAVYQATVPCAEVIVRRVFGVGGAGITNRHAFVQRWAWPSADWGSLPVEGGIEAAYRRELEASADPEGLLAEIRARLEAVRSPFRTAERFGVEEIVDPRDTRPLLCEWVRDAYERLPQQLGRSAHGMRP